MASAAAVISLAQTIDRLQISPHFKNISALNSCREIIRSAHDEVVSLREVLLLFEDDVSIRKVFSIARSCEALEAFESLLSDQFPLQYRIVQFAYRNLTPLYQFLQENIISKRVKVLDEQLIREAVCRLEDVAGCLAFKFQKSLVFSEDMEEDINSFTEMVMKIKEYGKEEEEKEEEEEEEEEEEAPYEFRKLDNLLTGFNIVADSVFEEILQRIYMNKSRSKSEKLNALDGQIREASCELEDTLEAHFSNHLHLQSDQDQRSSFSLDLQEVNQDIESLTYLLKKLKEDYVRVLFDSLPEDDDYDDGDEFVSSKSGFGGKRIKMIGFSDVFLEMRDLLTDSKPKLRILSLYGMAGIGKTTLAKKLFEDPSVSSLFEHRAWVAIGPKYRLRKILLGILAQVKPSIVNMLMEGDEKLAQYLFESLKDGRYLIVLDDVWDKQLVDTLARLLPDDNNGSRVLVTTRLGRVTNWDKHKMRFLNKEESWNLLRDKVFGEESCSRRLEKAGKKIAENCEGLPLTIVTIADLLSKAEKTLEYWNEVAMRKNSVFVNAYDKIMDVLLPSYNFLPQHSKACFLYMGVFPRNYEITRSQLIKLWGVEGFVDRHVSSKTLDTIIENLVDSNLLIAQQKGSTFNLITTFNIKTCTLHSSFWHLCKREAWNNKFSHIINSYADGLAESMESQRRLCIHNNILFGIKDVHNSMASISTARSLLCSGPPHLYPVPVCFGLKLLRVLDALSIRFYEFPIEVLKLAELKYFALTYNGDIPRSISELRKLQYFIVRRHLSIKYNGSHSYVPKDIWDMKELKHLEIMGSDVTDPGDGAFLPNLVTLLDVSARSCTEVILEKLHNLEKLGVRIESAPNAIDPFNRFDHISGLHRLKSLKCVVVNPVLLPESVSSPPPLSIFPAGIRKLTLSGLGYPWEEMSKLRSLPKLEVLKLRFYAFRGPKWETSSSGFLALKYLLIEDSDLVQWRVTRLSFLWLIRLILKNCYKLEEIPSEFHRTIQEIEVVDCNPLAVSCAEEIKEAGSKVRRSVIDVNVCSSWDNRNLNS